MVAGVDSLNSSRFGAGSRFAAGVDSVVAGVDSLNSSRFGCGSRVSTGSRFGKSLFLAGYHSSLFELLSLRYVSMGVP